VAMRESGTYDRANDTRDFHSPVPTAAPVGFPTPFSV
jgi:hypothetical protein